MRAGETGGGSPLYGRGPEACKTGRRQSSSDGESRETGAERRAGEGLFAREKGGRPSTPHPRLKDNDWLIIAILLFYPTPRFHSLGPDRSGRSKTGHNSPRPPSLLPAESPHRLPAARPRTPHPTPACDRPRARARRSTQRQRPCTHCSTPSPARGRPAAAVGLADAIVAQNCVT